MAHHLLERIWIDMYFCGRKLTALEGSCILPKTLEGGMGWRVKGL